MSMLAKVTFAPLSDRDLEATIRNVPDFPKPGIQFKDITPLLANPEAFAEVVARMSHVVKNSGATCVMGLESRGFIFGIAVAKELGMPFIPARKPGKLPTETVSVSYDLEYGKATLEVHKDSLGPKDRVAIVDDLLATGGTARAAGQIVEKLGAHIAGYFFAIELGTLAGRSVLGASQINSVLKY